jgi:hypothetical protein
MLVLVDHSLGFLPPGGGLIVILKALWNGWALEEVVTLIVANGLVYEPYLVGEGVGGRGPLRRRKVLAVDASKAEAAGLDVARHAPLLPSRIGILLARDEELQLLTDEAYCWAEAVGFVVHVGHWNGSGEAAVVAWRIVGRMDVLVVVREVRVVVFVRRHGHERHKAVEISLAGARQQALIVVGPSPSLRCGGVGGCRQLPIWFVEERHGAAFGAFR